MRTPVRVTFRGMPVSDELEKFCWQEARKLVKYHDRLTGCDVLVRSSPGAAGSAQHQYEVHVLLSLPGASIASQSFGLGSDAMLEVRTCFDRAGRQLHDYVSRRRHRRPTSQAS